MNLQHPEDVRARWRRLLIWPYLLGLHLVIAVLVFKTDFLSRAQARLSPDRGSALHPYVAETLTYHRWQQASAPVGSLVFIGDSITQGLSAAALGPGALNFGIGHLDSRQLLKILPDYPALQQARTIVLTLGINDYVKGLYGGLAGRYRDLVAALPAQTPLIWNGVMPARHPRIDPAVIRAGNDAIRQLCAERPNCRYVDTWSVLADAQGLPIAGYYLDDGVHLNADGYRRWIALLRPLLY